MLVLLKRDFFAPNASLYARNPAGTEIPDRFRKYLPDDARELSAPIKHAAPADTSLRDHDDARANMKALDDADEEAEKTRARNAERLRAELAKDKK